MRSTPTTERGSLLNRGRFGLLGEEETELDLSSYPGSLGSPGRLRVPVPAVLRRPLELATSAASAGLGWLAQMRRRHPQIFRAARLGGTALSFGLLAWVVGGAIGGVHLHSIRPLPILLAVILSAIYWAGLARAWASLVGDEPPTGEAMRGWFRSQPLRYLPGGIWGPAQRAAGLPGKASRRAGIAVLEALVTMAVAAALGGLASAMAFGGWMSLLLLVTAGVSGAGYFVRHQFKVVGPRVVSAMRWYVVGWLAYCGAVLAAQAATGPLVEPVRLVAAGLLAWIVGFLVLVAPSGAGVREYMYVVLAGGVLPRAELDTGALLARAILATVELVIFTIVVVRGRNPAEERQLPERIPRDLEALDQESSSESVI